MININFATVVFVILHLTLSAVTVSKLKSNTFYSAMTLLTLLFGYILNYVSNLTTMFTWYICIVSMVLIIEYVIHTFLILDKIKKTEDRVLVFLNLFLTVALYANILKKNYVILSSEVNMPSILPPTLDEEEDDEETFVEEELVEEEEEPVVGILNPEQDVEEPDIEVKTPGIKRISLSEEESRLSGQVLLQSFLEPDLSVDYTKRLLHQYMSQKDDIDDEVQMLFCDNDIINRLFHRSKSEKEMSFRTELQRKFRDFIYNKIGKKCSH